MVDATTENTNDASVKADWQHAPKIRVINAVAAVLAIMVAAFAILVVCRLDFVAHRMDDAHVRFEACTTASTNMMVASDYLTNEARLYVTTGDKTHLENYVNEITENRRRDQAMATIQEQAADIAAVSELSEAFGNSKSLSYRELYALKLVADATYTVAPEYMNNITLDDADATLAADAKQALAQNMLLGNEYAVMKESIVESVEKCSQDLVTELTFQESKWEHESRVLFLLLGGLIAAIAIIMVAAIIVNWRLVMTPMKHHKEDLEAERPLTLLGAYEICQVSNAYNELYAENAARTAALEKEATTDALTGLYNRGAYDRDLLAGIQGNIAFVLIDIDEFKAINDEHGHAMGDAVLRKVSRVVSEHFRGRDKAYRIGGDEFVVIMRDVTKKDRDIIEARLLKLADELSRGNGTVGVSVSFGVAFGNEDSAADELYRSADGAMYAVKHEGRIGFASDGDGSNRGASTKGIDAFEK